jgi:uncharacterized protein YcbK (DUF882 family)
VRVQTTHKAQSGSTFSCVARGFCAAALVAALSVPSGAPLHAAGDTRTLHLHNIHTHEDLSITYKKDGRYDEAALKRLNAFLRDWRQEREIRMDPQLFDMLWEVHREVKATGPIHIVCGYRSPETNAMLRQRSRGVAKTSLHMQGKAIDFSIPSANVADVRAAALRIQGGGVGYYPTSGIPFVHMDVGNVRHWPRMTREQLAKIFPDGRTVHIPADGNPLPGYELALADLQNGNRRPASPTRSRSLIAALFGQTQDTEEESDNVAISQSPAAQHREPKPQPAAAPATQVAAVVPPAEPAPVPLPRARPTYEVATAESRPAPAPAPRRTEAVNLAALTPNQIVNLRGFWEGLPDAPPDLPKPATDQAMQNQTNARALLASSLAAAGREVTASVGPFAPPDRVPPEVALAYAAQADGRDGRAAAARVTRATSEATKPAALIATKGSASIAIKPAEIITRANLARTAERLNDPWLRGLIMADSVQHALTVTVFGDPDLRSLAPYLRKPASAVMMTFSHDPHLGMTTEAFTGSAVVFQATVTFESRRTASLQ